MEARIWEDLCTTLEMPRVDPVVTGFNANLDRVITVTPGVLKTLEHLPAKVGGTVLARLKHAMRFCSAGELFIRDPLVYKALSEPFASSGTCAMGGQAGIAATHLHNLGIPSVTCVIPRAGRLTCRMLQDAGVLPLTFGPEPDHSPDLVHLVFEFSPGLLPLATGVVPRNNRFIVSPLHNASTALIPDASLDAFLDRIAPCRRAFLSGYQYLRTEQEFRTAAGQVRMIRGVHPGMRTHVECVTGADCHAMALMLRHIFPACDSIGLNERELGLFTRALQETARPPSSPVDCVRDAIALAESTGVSRVHVHTFGWYLLIIDERIPSPEASRDSLLLAARATAAAAGGDGQEQSPEGLQAYEAVRTALGPEESPGIFREDNRIVVLVPTFIARNIRKTAGLGDVLSSTAFVTDPF